MVPGTVGGQFRRWGRSISEHQESFQKNSEVGCAGAARRQGVRCGPSVGQHSTHSRAIGEPSQKSDGGLVRFCKFVHQASAFPYLITVPVHDEARIITKNVTINGSPKKTNVRRGLKTIRSAVAAFEPSTGERPPACCQTRPPTRGGLVLLAQLPFSLHSYETAHLNLQLALRLAVQPGVEVPDEDHGVAVDSSI